MEIEILFIVIQVLVVVLGMLWATIGVILVYRKRRAHQLEKIEYTFATETSAYLYPLSGETADLIKVQRAFRAVGIVPEKPQNVQYLIDLMIRAQRTFLGENHSKLEMLFKQIPPFRASISKLNSKKWYVKARGIREIYEMDQKQHIKRIITERNNDNIFVRREAQIAMVVFLGWESLRFLPYLKREMTLWQQIKVVEKLHDLHSEANVGILQKVYDTQRPYAQELIMRIIRKFELTSELDYIIGFLEHGNFDRREAAIYCLSTFSLNEQRLRNVKEIFFKVPNTEQQVQLLKYIQKVSPEVDLKFYKEILHKGNDILKLSTAEILWNSGYVEEVQEYYYQQYSELPLEV